jgi:hypothetical protein
MRDEHPLTSELDSAPVSVWARVRQVLAVPGRLLGVLFIPDRMMPRVVGEERSFAAISAIVLCALLSAFVVGQRLDVTQAVLAREAKPAVSPDGAVQQPKSDREIGETIVKERTIAQVMDGLSAGLGEPFWVFVRGLGVLFFGWYVGGRPQFWRALAAGANASLPIAAKHLFVAAMAWPAQTLGPAEVEAIRGLSIVHAGPFVVDAFSLWAFVLFAFGISAAASISRKRAFVTMFVLFAMVVLLKAGCAGMSGGQGPGMPPGGDR